MHPIQIIKKLKWFTVFHKTIKVEAQINHVYRLTNIVQTKSLFITSTMKYWSVFTHPFDFVSTSNKHLEFEEEAAIYKQSYIGL